MERSSPVTSYVIAAEADLNKILQATGKPVDGEQVKKVIDTLKGKNIEDVLFLDNSVD